MHIIQDPQTGGIRFRLGYFTRDFDGLACRKGLRRSNLREDRVALVTGGSRGLGLELVLRLVSHGIKVINVDVLSPTHKFQDTDRVYYYHCDITDFDEVKALYRTIRSEHGPITILINNAGITRIKTVDAMTHHEFESVMAVNLIGAYIMMNVFLPDMFAGEHGFIVNIASVLGEITPARLTAYGASKGGLIAVHNSLSRLLKKQSHGSGAIRTLLVCPGKINTAMFAKVETPSKIFAPDIQPGKLADQIVNAIYHDSTTTLRFPYYVNILPFFKHLSWPYVRLLKKCSGMDRVTAAPCSNNDVQ